MLIVLLTGNLAELHQKQAGEADFRYQDEFGGVARIKGPFGVCLDAFHL